MANTTTFDKNTVFQAPFSIQYDEYDQEYTVYDGDDFMVKSSTKRAFGGYAAVFKRRIDAVKFLMRYAEKFSGIVKVEVIPAEALKALAELVTTATTIEETQEPEQVVEVVKSEPTPDTITYTIVPRETSNGIPFVARVFVPGQEVQDFDPMPSAWWMYTKGDLVNAVNKQFKGSWYLKPEAFEARVAEMTEPIVDSQYIRESVGMPADDCIAAIREDRARREAPTTRCCTCDEIRLVDGYGECQDCATAPEIIEPTSELTDEQRQAVLAQRRAESAAYLEQMDRETQAYIAQEIARSQIQTQVELQHKERITTMDSQSFWKPGSIVMLQGPYKPSEPPDALLRAIAGAGSTYHQMIAYDKWHGFTHGIIAQVYAHDHRGNVSHVSLHLYDPELHVIYIDNAVGIPTYVDYHISELTPYKDSAVTGYEVIR